MKLKSFIVWVVGVMLSISAVDTVRDPPAVNPHTVTVASRLCEARGSVCERLLNSDRSCSSHLQKRWIAFPSLYEPNLPNDWMALTACAADPSPPALKAQRNLHFRS
jgi:hypothetical protein